MLEKWIEVKELIKAGKYDEALAKIDEVIAATPSEAKEDDKGKDDEKPTIGGGGSGLPIKK